MIRRPVNPLEPDPESIRLAAETILKGGLVLYPADTIYGLGCSPLNTDAVRRIFELKERPAGKGVLVLIPDRSWVRRFAVRIPPLFDRLAQRFWPGPLTVILPAAESVPSMLSGENRTIGLRWPDSPLLRDWLHALQGPLVSTSANRSGQPPSNRAARLSAEFSSADLFLDAGDLPDAQPSTVVDLTGSRPRLLREGRLAGEVRVFLESRGETTD